MPRYAANLSTLFTDVGFLDRFERAARAGFDAVEFQFPYARPAAEVKARLDANLVAVLFNLPPGAAGERGLACLPGRRAEFEASVAEGLAYADATGVRQLHCMAGMTPAGGDVEVLRRTFVESVRHAARAAQTIGARVLVEPLNRYDVPGYYLGGGTAQALALLDEIVADNAFLQYDVYHAQRGEGELAATIERHRARIGHIQIADNPGRHEPGSGEINFAFLLAHIDRIGYAGHVGCEYLPQARTEARLGWRDRPGAPGAAP
ncbi:MAG: TIM barrel protein [Caldimonas sp.]